MISCGRTSRAAVTGKRLYLCIPTFALLLGLSDSVQAAGPVAPAATSQPGGQAGLAYPREWTGDLDGMKKRRLVRMLVVYSKTFYFLDKARQRGATYEAGVELEKELNSTGKNRTRRATTGRRFHCTDRSQRR
jgi:hypothetical protein